MKQPALYIPHGGGPWPWMDDPRGLWTDIDAHLTGILESLPGRPDAIVVITAHWEAPQFTVASGPRPALIFDYYGFPEHTYGVSYPAPGSPEVAAELVRLASEAGITLSESHEYGWDHGVFVPLHVINQAADIPIVAVSLAQGLDPELHIAFGRALAPIRDRNVLIVGSGMSTHDLSGRLTGEQADAFDEWLENTMMLPALEREAQLAEWSGAPGGRASHPREEHLLPLMVVAGAGSDDEVTRSMNGTAMGFPIAGYRFS